MSKSIIRIEEAWKTYKLDLVEVHAVQGINIDIKKGEFVPIVGKSDSGKSTTLNLIGAILGTFFAFSVSGIASLLGFDYLKITIL